MQTVAISLPRGKGLDRRLAPVVADKETFYTLQNLRHVRTSLGQLEQTPRFRLQSTITQGTYYDGGSLTEPTTSAVRFYKECGTLGTLIFTDYCATTSAGVQLKCIHRVSGPSGTTAIKGCLLTVVNAATMSVTLGSTYDIEIDGTATFKWRVNGGAYTTLVAINATSGNLIDSNTIRIYWLASTGFTVADTWVFRRNDAVFGTGITLSPVIFKQIGAQLFFIRDLGIVSVCELASIPVIRDVGYFNVIGTNLVFDASHLIVIGDSSTGSYVLQSSDRAAYENFLATDVNEADTYTPGDETDRAVTTTNRALAGVVMQSRLFVFMTDGLYYADYAGLPVPYAFKLAFPIRIGRSSGNVLTKGDSIVYFYTEHELCTFDGGRVQMIFDFTSLDSSWSPRRIVYNPYYKEVVVLSSSHELLIYSEISQTFHTRHVDFSVSGCTTIAALSTGEYYCGTESRKVIREDSGFSSTPVFDYADGASFATPTLITQAFGSAIRTQEAAPVFLATTPSAAASAGYSVGAFIQWTVKWIVSNTGLLTGTVTSTAPNTWTSASIDNQISHPRVEFRYIGYKLELTGTDGTKPPSATTLQAFETTYQAPNNPNQSR